MNRLLKALIGAASMTLTVSGVAHAQPYTAFPSPSYHNVNVDGLTVTATGGSVARNIADRFAETTNVIDLGADPSGVRDSAPAFRSAVGSSRHIVVPPGTYRFSSTVAAPCCAFDPPAVLVQGKSNFEIDGYGATIVIDPVIALSTAFHFDKDTGFVVRGLTIAGTRSGLTAGQENTAFGLSSDVDFTIADIRAPSGFGGNGAVIAGDWLVNGTFSGIRMDGVGHCFDIAYLRGVRVSDITATGADTNGASGSGQVGQTCFSVIEDPPNVSQNNTGVSFTATSNVTVTGVDASNFQTGAYITTGTGYTLVGNRWHDNPGVSSTPGLGMWIRNDSSVSSGAPPSNIAVADVFSSNGAAVSGYGLYLSAGTASAGDVTTNVNVSGSVFYNNASIGIHADGTANFSSIDLLGAQFGGAAQTTAVSSNASKIASSLLTSGTLAITGAITPGGGLVLPNNVSIQGRDSSGTGHPVVFVDPSNELVLRPASSAADVTISDYGGNALAQFFSGGATITSLAARSNPVTSQSGTTYTLATTDCGTTVRFIGTSPATVTVPTGLPIGCHINVTQVQSAGTVTFSPGSGETIRAYSSATQTLGQYAVAQILIDSAATFELSGQVH